MVEECRKETILSQKPQKGGSSEGLPPLIFRRGRRKTQFNPLLTGLCLGNNTLSRVQRGLAPTKAGQ